MQKQQIVTIAAVALVAVVGYFVLTAPDRRSTGDKIGDAINELHEGPEKAARQLEDRTPGEKLGDVIEDETEEAKKALNQE